SVYRVLTLSVFAQLNHLVPSQSWRQGSVFDICPGSAVAWAPEPMVALIVVVTAADEKHIVRNPHGDVDTGIAQKDHLGGSLYNHGRRWANVHIDVHLGTSLHGKQSAQKHER